MFQEKPFKTASENGRISEKLPSSDREEAILNILDKIIEKRNVKEFSLFRKKTLKIEKKVKKIGNHEKSLMRFLSIYEIKNLGIEKIGTNLYKILIEKTENFNKLDPEYAYKGGAARAILEKELGFKNITPPRDIDLTKITDDENQEKDDEMAMKYSPEDFENGYGVEGLEEDYFESRDFTLNELIVNKNEIILTKECLLDTARGIIRFSDYEKKQLYDNHKDRCNGDFESIDENAKPTYLEKYKEEKSENKKKFFINNKLMAKALRFLVIQSNKRWSKIADDEIYEYLDINNFHIALHLNRALEQGHQIAIDYVKELIKFGQLDADKNNDPEKIMEKFITMMQEKNSFVFRFESSKKLRKEEGVLENQDRFLELGRKAGGKYQDEINNY